MTDTNKTAALKTETLVATLGSPEDYIKSKGTKSAAIRALSADGWSKGNISRYLDIRFQHVRNVLVTPLKKS